MYINIFFLILVMLLINLSPSGGSEKWLFSPGEAFTIGMTAYGMILGMIISQNKLFPKFVKKYKSRMLALVNLELLLFLAFFHFFLGSNRIFDFVLFQIVAILFSLALYFLGLIVFHKSARSSNKFYDDLRILVPFALPFLFLTLFFDLIQNVPNDTVQDFLLHSGDTNLGIAINIGVTILFLILLMIFLPLIMLWVWKCKNLNNSELTVRLDNLCKKAGFKYAGFKSWTVMENALTAAIIGIVPRYRYILFTKRLLKEMSEESIEAILAHEIGHSYRRHLLLYPLIFLGMSVGVGYFSLIFVPSIITLINWGNQHYQSQFWGLLFPFLLFLGYSLAVGLYLRIVFGYFSRLFERQADLHVFVLGIPPEHLINSLHYIGVETGNTHHLANWHHFGIQQRIDFLRSAMNNPELVEQHHRRVKRDLIIYFILLAILSILLFN